MSREVFIRIILILSHDLFRYLVVNCEFHRKCNIAVTHICSFIHSLHVYFRNIINIKKYANNA